MRRLESEAQHVCCRLFRRTIMLFKSSDYFYDIRYVFTLIRGQPTLFINQVIKYKFACGMVMTQNKMCNSDFNYLSQYAH